ncbi:MAG: hypothetical protein ACXABO_02140 [Promethearchaeota archaeon]|jgi:hypothetical protein
MGRIQISEFLALALSIEYIIIIHRESLEIIYYKTIGIFDPDFLDIFRSSIQYEVLNLPLENEEIEQATLEGRFLITRADVRFCVTLVLNKLPTLFTREVLKFFCKLFEEQYTQEISNLYTHLQGDISIFHRTIKSNQTIEDIVDEVFHLYLTYPFKIGSIKREKLSPDSKKIYQLAKNLAHKAKGKILLENLFNEVTKSLKTKDEDIANAIFNLVQKKGLLPIPLNQIKKKFSLHH